jgi:hypothetical protein
MGYADDFILLCNGPKAEAERLKQELREFLWDELHLELSEEKTHITHATDGFDFLGFHIRREEPVDNKPWLRVTPTRKSEQRLRDTIRKMTSRATGWEPVPEKIRAINRVLRGWGNYYKQVSSSASREELDWWVSQRMLKWLCNRHKEKDGRRFTCSCSVISPLVNTEGKSPAVLTWKTETNPSPKQAWIPHTWKHGMEPPAADKQNGGKLVPKSCKGMATVVPSVEAPKSWKSITSNLRVEMFWTTC